MKIYCLQPRPVSIIITQILMLINLVPVAIGVLYALVRAIITDPAGLISVRAILFIVSSTALLVIFLGFGFGGLWKRKRRGYWLGLLFLATGIAVKLYEFVPLWYQLLLGSKELPEHRYQTWIAFDLVVQILVILLLSALFLKLLLGKNEKLFFNSPFDRDAGT